MSKIIVYEHFDFGGRSKEYTSDVPDLNADGFNDTISSMKVIGNPWLAYTDCFYKGALYIFEEGEYPVLEVNDSFSSLQLVQGDLTNPVITLFEYPCYGGQKTTIRSETNLSRLNFNKKACSHKVQKGTWVIYENENMAGAKMIARAGENLENYAWWYKRPSYVRPLKPGQ